MASLIPTKWFAVVLLGLVCAASFVVRGRVEAGAGLRGEYVAEHRWGVERYTRTDSTIDTGALLHAWPYAPPPRFRARWTGFLTVTEPGWYVIGTRSDDGSTVTIDTFPIVDNSGDHEDRRRTGRARLATGAHPIVIDYQQSGGDFAMELLWGRDGSELAPVPRWALWREAPTASRIRAARVMALVPSMLLGTLIGFVIWAGWSSIERLQERVHPDWVLLLILGLATYFRLYLIELPLADAHGWRQVFNADVARHFAQGSLRIWYPEVNWGGSGDPRVSMEFPLLPWLTALFYRVMGEREIIARLLTMVFSLATVVGIYGLGASVWNRAVGRGAAFLLAISPSAIFFGRAFIADTPMVCFSVFGVWGFSSYFQTGRRAPLVWGTVATALACMVKLPALVVFGPIAWLAFERHGFRLWRDRAFIAGAGTAFLLTVAWYAHADRVFHETSLGVAIFHPVGGYPSEVMQYAGPMTLVSSWNTRAQLSDPEYYRTLADRFWLLHWTPFGTILVAIGALVRWRMPGRRFVDVWFASVALFVLLAAEGNRWHEFYQLPILLPSALYFGFAAQPLFDVERLSRLAPLRVAPMVSLGALAWIAFVSFDGSRVVPELFRPFNLRERPMRIGGFLQDVTPPDALVITTEYERFGGNSPVLLHYARRRGWSFDTTSLTPELIKRLHSDFGAKYFVTLIWSDLERQRPEVAAYLKTQESIPVAASDAALFELR